MKKLFYLIAVMALMAAFVACEKEELESQLPKLEEKSNILDKHDDFEILEFENKESFNWALSNKTETRGVNSLSPSFISLLSNNPSFSTRSSQDEELTYYTSLGYDDLVPNKEFAKLLNPNGEIIISDTVYRINRNGTYYYPKELAIQFKEIYSTDSIGVQISENLYQIAENIYRFDTFKDLSASIEVDLDSLNKLEVNGSFNETRAVGNDPNYGSFPSYKADRHTWLGKARQGLFGNDKWYSVRIPNISVTRKVRGRLYAYHYVFYSESGVTGQVKLKNWIGWSKVNAEEIRVGWKYVILSITVPELKNIQRPKFSHPVMTSLNKSSLPNGNTIVNWVHLFVSEDIASEQDVMRYVSIATKLAFDQLKQELINKPNSKLDFKKVVISSPATMYEVVLDDMIIRQNEKEINKIFTTNTNFVFKADLLNLPTNVVGWAATVAGSVKQEYPRLYAGEAVICGKVQSQWAGMRIVK